MRGRYIRNKAHQLTPVHTCSHLLPPAPTCSWKYPGSAVPALQTTMLTGPWRSSAACIAATTCTHVHPIFTPIPAAGGKAEADAWPDLACCLHRGHHLHTCASHTHTHPCSWRQGRGRCMARLSMLPALWPPPACTRTRASHAHTHPRPQGTCVLLDAAGRRGMG